MRRTHYRQDRHRDVINYQLSVQWILTAFYITVQYDGPWFATQLILSAAIGAFSFLIFSYCRTRYPLLFAPRTKLKGVYSSAFVLSRDLT